MAVLTAESVAEIVCESGEDSSAYEMTLKMKHL